MASQFIKRWELNKDKIFNLILAVSAVILIILGVGFFLSLFNASLVSLKKFGLSFFTGVIWDPVQEKFGALPYIYGTLVTSFISLAISLPFSIAISIVLGEYFQKGFFAEILRYLTELIAGVPSVVLGFWGLFFLVPLVREFEIKIGVTPYGVGILTASIILAFMILPYSASIGKDAMRLVPNELKEAAYALGATRWEMIKKVMLPYARSGIIAGVILSLGRALGETMAVTMVIGNYHGIPENIFSPGNTIASVIANEFTEATSEVYLSSLMYLGMTLFIITTVVNLIGRFILKKLQH
ncbi:phosphate transport system permease protein [Candidatus Kryptobacter tengchongensis]|uniref:Phosphate transport system permease protein n=1 Tax=Kryptobacter tengchongensis TaxID=1643429 RepID=A0A656D196_KRYT1|nr:phosphate ABC transporter permease subunit PstC [Candidatus Kryptobacter tengchongensis]CUS82687.1 phosphate transport system permease protein [Candidatus Kryptobacter tengchongensis]CUS96809.1 phosphate transport system permease protein [Candidatus Kryptobacter tengchongensis]CUU01326.1 phosphate transport system permease protein [Candidatus Kryptobacter tengchongensis]